MKRLKDPRERSGESPIERSFLGNRKTGGRLKKSRITGGNPTGTKEAGNYLGKSGNCRGSFEGRGNGNFKECRKQSRSCKDHPEERKLQRESRREGSCKERPGESATCKECPKERGNCKECHEGNENCRKSLEEGGSGKFPMVL